MIGEVINGKYRVEAAFSESHMYEILTASELATGSTVVVKILKEVMASNAERVKGFSDEIRSFASLSHPLIAEVLDVDMYGDRPFVVSQLVHGSDLYNIIRNETLAFAECCRIIQDLATVLQYAADQNVECRTIKLSNVLRSNEGKITVLSFTHPRLRLASSNQRSVSSGVHSDLYFLGGTFYEMLSGESLIRRRGGVNELWDMKLEKSLRIRHPDLTPEQITKVVDFVRCTLTREMRSRFSSHEEFLKALADLSGIVRTNSIRNKARQLSMASQVVDALNGRMSNVNMNLPTRTMEAGSKKAMTATCALTDSVALPAHQPEIGLAEPMVEGNLALVVDNSDRDQTTDPADDNTVANSNRPSRSHLRLVKPEVREREERSEVWETDAHWLRNPVIFMGLCLIVMVMLILFW